MRLKEVAFYLSIIALTTLLGWMIIAPQSTPAPSTPVTAGSPERLTVSFEAGPVAFTPDGSRVAVAVSAAVTEEDENPNERNTVVRIYQTKDLKLIERLVRTHPAEMNLKTLSWSPNGRWLLETGWEQQFRLWDTQKWRSYPVLRPRATQVALDTRTGETRIEYQEHDDSRSMAATWSPDSRTFAVASSSNKVGFWDAASRKLKRQMTLWADEMAISPNGHYLAIDHPERRLELWDLREPQRKKAVRRFVGHQEGSSSYRQIVWSPDGKWLAAATEDGFLVWEVNHPSPQPITHLSGQTVPVSGLAFDPTEKWSTGFRLAWGDMGGIMLASFALNQKGEIVSNHQPLSQTPTIGLHWQGNTLLGVDLMGEPFRQPVKPAGVMPKEQWQLDAESKAERT